MLHSGIVQEEFVAQKQRVMLIEDNDDCREILATMIRLMGYKVIFPDGDAANETATSDPCQPTAETRLSTTEAVKLRVA